MGLRVQCPKCEQVLDVEQPSADGVIECPYCQQRMKVAPAVPKVAPSADAAAPPPPPPAEEPWPPAEEPVPLRVVKPGHPRLPAKQTSPGLVIGIVAAGVVVVGLAAGVVYLMVSGNNPDVPPTPAPADIAKTPAPVVTPMPTPVILPVPVAPLPSPSPAPTPATGPVTSAVDLDAAALFKKASPAVVQIEVMQADFTPTGRGSGFLVSSDGLVVTNHHVMRSGRKGLVLFGDGKAYRVATILAWDEKKDLAVLKINGTGFPYLELLPKKAKPEVGARAFAIGSPRGLTNSLSEGLVSGLRDQDNREVVQTTAGIAPGNSGGPLLDARARVLGVNTVKMRDEDGLFKDLNFAVAAKEVHEILAKANAARAKMPVPTGGKSLDPQAAADFTQAYEHVSKGKWLDAAVLGQALRKKNPENIEVLLLSAFLNLRMNQPDEAMETYKKVVQLDPNEAEGHLGLGMVYNQRKMWKEAVEVLSLAVKLRPNDAGVQHAYGEALLQLERKEEALAALKEATRLDPQNAAAWLVLGQAYVAQKLYTPAEDAFKNAIKHKPDEPLAYAYLGLVEYQNGHTDAAIASAGMALRIHPTLPMALYVMGMALTKKGDLKKAGQALQSLQPVDPKLAGELADAIKAKGGSVTPKKDGDKKDDGKKDDGKKDAPKPPGPEPKTPKSK